MNKLAQTAAIFAILTSLNSSVYATDGIVAIGPKIGIQGIGVDARAPITESLLGRIGFNYFSFSKSKVAIEGNLKLDATLRLLSVPVMLDWHPFENSGFRLSGGVAYNGNKLSLKGTANGPVTINNITYPAAQIGSVTGTLSLGNTLAGLATIGYDSSFVKDGAWSFNFEAGVMYTGSPKLSISATGTGGQTVKDVLDRAIKEDSGSWKKYLKYYPILSLGFKYKF